jgi:hypothetical protein
MVWGCVEADEGSPWERLLRAVLGAGFHRVIWNGAPAVHSFTEYTTDCSQVRVNSSA